MHITAHRLVKQARVLRSEKQTRIDKVFHTDEGDLDVSQHKAPGKVRM